MKPTFYLRCAWHLLSLAAACMVSLPLLAYETDEEGELQRASLGECQLESGEVVLDCFLTYRTYGKLNTERDNVVLVTTWYGGRSENLAYMVNSGLIDPMRYFVIIVDEIGNGNAISPSNSILQPGLLFPQFTIGDMVSAQHRLLTGRFDLAKVHAIVGLSMGGMQAFEWGVQFPGFSEKIIAGIGTPQTAAFDRNMWTASNRMLEWWLACRCDEAERVRIGMDILAEVPERFERLFPDPELEIENRLKRKPMTQGRAQDMIYQARAMISHDVARNYAGDLGEAAAVTRTSWLIWLGADDRIVTPGPAKEFAKFVGSSPTIVDNDCGHSEAWCAGDAFARDVRKFLSESGEDN